MRIMLFIQASALSATIKTAISQSNTDLRAAAVDLKSESKLKIQAAKDTLRSAETAVDNSASSVDAVAKLVGRLDRSKDKIYVFSNSKLERIVLIFMSNVFLFYLFYCFNCSKIIF